METKNLICIECPRGCNLSIEINNGKVGEINGAFCVKGKAYAQNELTRPLRVVTSTVRLESGEMLSVKTDKGVLKSKIFEVMDIINELKPARPVAIGQIIKENIDDEGANLVATKNIN